MQRAQIVIFKLIRKKKEMASDYNKLTNGVKTITIIIYKERLRIYDRV